MDRLPPCDINRFVPASIYPRSPLAREHTKRPWLWPHRNLTSPWISRGRPHWLRRLTSLEKILQIRFRLKAKTHPLHRSSSSHKVIRLCGNPVRFNARPVTGRKYHYNPLSVIALDADAPHRLIHEPGNLPSFLLRCKEVSLIPIMWLASFCRQQRGSIWYVAYAVFKVPEGG